MPARFDAYFVGLWRYYLMYCEGGFRGGAIDVANEGGAVCAVRLPRRSVRPPDPDGADPDHTPVAPHGPMSRSPVPS